MFPVAGVELLPMAQFESLLVLAQPVEMIAAIANIEVRVNFQLFKLIRMVFLPLKLTTRGFAKKRTHPCVRGNLVLE
jgi:hypothetical protein